MLLYHEGEYKKHDYSDATHDYEIIKDSADHGYTRAMFHFARANQLGKRIPVNKKIAAEYYQKAAKKGHVESMVEIAKMYFNGDGVEMNKSLAKKYFQNAVNAGYTGNTEQYLQSLDQKNVQRIVQFKLSK